MASLIKRSGRYYAQFFSANRSPQRKQVSLNTPRKRAASKALRRLEDAYSIGEFDPWTDDPVTLQDREKESVTFSEALDRFLSEKEELGRTDSTLESYGRIVGQFKDRTGNPPVDTLAAADLKKYVHDESVSKGTRSTRYRHVRAFMNWIEEKGLITRNPLDRVNAPPSQDPMPKAVREDDLEAICAAVRNDYIEKVPNLGCREGDLLWLISLFRFALYTGLRAGEIARLRWGHLDFERGLIYIYKQKNRKQETVPLSKKAQAALEKLERRGESDFVFYGRDPERSPDWLKRYTSRKFRQYRRAAGLPEKLTFHSLRHGFCTLLAEKGKSAFIIKEAARHASVETSQRYVSIANHRLKDEINDAFGD